MGKFLDYTKKKREEEEKASSSSGAKIGSFGKYVTEKKIGLDTLQSDLSSVSETLSKVYGGWQDADTMANTKSAVSSMYDRLNKYKSYVNSTSSDDLTDFNKGLDELLTGYKSALDQWDNVASTYSQFQNADAYGSAKKDYELSEKYKGLDYAGVHKAMVDSEDDDWLSQYGVKVGYSSLKDYNTDLENLSKKMASLYGEEKQKAQEYYDKLEAKKNQYALENASEKYAYLMDAEDFAERSQYQSTQNAKKFLGMEYTEYGDEVYEFINNVNGARDNLIAQYKEGNGATELEQHGYEYMTDDEVKMFNYLYNQDKEKAYDYLDDIAVSLSKRSYDKTTETWNQWADDSAFASLAMSAATPILNMASGIGSALATVDEAVTGKEYNPYSGLRMPSNAVNDIRQYVGENIAESTEGMEILGQNIPSFLYQTGMSIADTALGSRMFGKGFTAVMGMNSATQKAKELKEAGEDEETILKGAVASGLAEAVFEKFSIDNLLKPKSAETLLGMVRETAKQMGIESSEEIFTEIANTVSDTLIRQNTSDLAKSYEEYLYRGYTEEEAKKLVGKDFASNVMWSGIGGALSGGVMGGVSSGANLAGNASLGSAIRENNNVSDLGEITSGLNNDTYAKYLQLIDSGKIKNGQLGGLYNKVSEEVETNYQTEKKNADLHTIANRANEFGERKNSGIIATAVQKKLNNETLSSEERTALQSDTAKAIMQEISRGEITTKRTGSFKDAYDTRTKMQSVLTTPKSEETARVQKRVAEMNTGAETMDNESGQKIEIEGMRKDEEGNTVLQTSEGERLLSDVTLSDHAAEVVAMAEGMDDTKADTFVSLYKEGMDVEEYKTSFELAFSYGQNGFGAENVLKNKGILTEEQAASAYESGIKFATEARQKQIDEVTAKHFSGVTPGTFDDSEVDYGKINTQQKAAIDFSRMLSKATGVNIIFFQSEADENGHRTAENGRFDRSTNTVYLDVYAGVTENIAKDSILPTLSHETTHWMKDKAPEAYSKLSGVVMDVLSKEYGISPVDLVHAEMKRYKDTYGKDVSEEYAQDELIARACEDMLSGNRNVQELVSQMDEKTAKTFSERLKVAFEKIKEWLADLLSNYKSNSEEAKIVQKYADKVNELQEAWDDAFDKAIKANQVMQTSHENMQKAASDRAQHSERNQNSISAIESRLLAQLQGWLQGKMPAKGYFELGTTPDILQKFGAKELPIIMEQGVVWKFTSNYNDHGIAIDEIAKLPSQIAEPVLLFKGSVPNSFVVLTELEDKQGREVIAALHLDKMQDRIRVNRVASVYGKDNVGNYVTAQIDKGNLLYADKKRSEIWFTSRGLQLPKLVQTLISTSNGSIPQTAKNATENTQFSERDSEGNGLTKEQLEYFKDSKVRDAEGNLKPMYHGTGRADRVGYHFREDRATSGPMAFFTDSKDIADNYARDKQDTSIAYDEMYRDYYTQFRIEVNGQNLSVSEAWEKLPTAKRVEIRKKAPHVTFDDDMENIIYDENADRGTGGFDKYRINEHKGNYLSALTGEWLEDGTLYGNEEMFLDVLSLVGLDNVQYMNPDARVEKTYQVYLNVTNPFSTTDISEEMLQAFKDTASITEYNPRNSADADMWDKNNFRPEAWIEKLENDIANGTTYSWTSIPDFVTNTLKAHGYDGIFDEGGKGGGAGHQVVIPFYSNQVKDITNASPTEDVDIRYSERNAESIYDAVGELKRLQKENEKLKKDVERLRQRNRLEHTVTGGTVLNESQIASVASYLLKNADSTYNKEQLTEELKDIYKYLQGDDVTWDILMLKATDAAQRIVAEKRERTVPNDYAKEILYMLRNTKVSLNDTQKAEAKYAYGKDWYKMYFGRVLVTNDGIPLDSMWQEWAQMYPDVFDADMPDADMATEVLNAYDAVKASSEIVEAYDRTEMEREIAVEIYNQFWNVSPVRTLADKYEREIANLKHEKNKALYEKKLAAAQKYDQAIKQLKYEHRVEMRDMKAQYNQRKTEAVYQTKERYQKTIKELRTKRAEEIRQIKEKSKEYNQAYRDRLARKAEIDKITKKALKLNTWLVKNSKEAHVPEILKKPVAAVLKSLNFSSERLLGMHGGDKTGTPTQKDFSLSKAFEDLANMVANINDAQVSDKDVTEMYGYVDLPADFVEFVRNTSTDINNLLRSVGDNEYILNEMSLDQLKEIDNIISTLTTSVTQMNKALAASHGKSIANLAQGTMQYTESIGKHKKRNKATEWVDKFLNFDNALPVYAFKMFGEGGERIFEAFQDGWDKFAFNVKHIMDRSEEIYDSKEVKEWSKEIHEFDVLNGTEKVHIKMTSAQIMSLYCLQKREQAKGHLIGGGIRVADFDDGKGTVAQPDGATLQENDINRITAKLTKRQIDVADQLQEFMNKDCADWGNEVSMIRFGYKAFGEPNYFPIKSDSNNLLQDDAKEKENSLFRLLNMSFTKGTIQNANNRVVIDNIFDVFASHTSDMAKYNALALPVLDAFKWYNYKEKIKVDPANKDDKRFATKGVKQDIENAYGAAAKSYIVQFLRDINGAESGGITSGEALSKKMMSNYKTASVGANLRVAILQPTAYLRASVVIDPKYLSKAMFKKPQIKKAKETCGIALWKSMGFYDTNISKGVAEQIKHDDSWYDKTKEYSMKLAEIGDSMTWGYLYNACEAEVSDKQPGLTGKAKEEAIAKRLREVIYATQVVDSTMTRTQMMRNRSTLNQMLTSFMSEPMVSYNVLHDCYIQYEADKRRTGSKGTALKRNGKKIARAMLTYTLTTFASALAGALPDTLRDDEEEDFATLFAQNAVENAMSDALGMIPLLKDVFSVMQGYSATRMDQQYIASTWSAWKNIVKAVENGEFTYKTVYSVMRAISQITGIPLSNLMRDGVAIWNNTIGENYDSVKLK